MVHPFPGYYWFYTFGGVNSLSRHQNPTMVNLCDAHLNLANTLYVKAKFRCPGQGKIKMSTLC